MRAAYKVRAYPDPEQAAILARTFGCVRVVWNRTLAARHARYQAEGKGTSDRESDAALTAMKKLPDLAWPNEVSSVPLEQTLRHQHQAFGAFFAERARYPRFCLRRHCKTGRGNPGARAGETGTPTREGRNPRPLALGAEMDVK
jgi:putative transposase